MKVGVLTFHLGPNYGGYWQALCLVKAIQQLGHEAELINYYNKRHWESNRLKWWVYKRPWMLWHDYRKHNTFKKAFTRMPLSPFTTDPSQVDWNTYDAIVCGSDIVWNCEYERLGRDPVYYGQFPVPYRGRLVAYAPSIGSMSPGYAAPTWVSEALEQFHFIGVRDENTREFVHTQIGQVPELVSDPTWLTNGGEAASPVFPRRTKKDFLLVYSYPLKASHFDVLRSFARAQGLKTVGVGYRQPWCDANWGDVDTTEWVQLFRQAAHVVTGTFHGTLYSIREQASFCVPAHLAIDARVSTALAVVGLAGRHTSNPEALPEILEDPIDYATVEPKRQEYAAASLKLLEQALS